MTPRTQIHLIGLWFIVSGAGSVVVLDPAVVQEGGPFSLICAPSKVGLDAKKNSVVQISLSRKLKENHVTPYIASVVPSLQDKIIHLDKPELSLWSIFPPKEDNRVVLMAVKRQAETSDAGIYSCVVYYLQNGAMENRKQDNTLQVLPRSPRPIVLHSPVVKGSTFMAYCDVSRVKIATKDYALNQLQIWHASKCGKRYSLIGQLDLAINRSKEIDSLTGLPKNWVLEKNEKAENLPKLHGSQLLLRVRGSSQQDGGCFQCKVVYTIKGGRPEAVISEVTVTIKDKPDDYEPNVRFRPFALPEKQDFQAFKDEPENDGNSVLSGAMSRLLLFSVTSFLLINY
ncbi:uncharacterized protein LOC131954547 [Physella acuta]|uniref:uncharacterized protein LOC131954547 n=1 Tax=Physella acuta TaxID=109671 RepID=UPI0027DC7061|nr:uncharacterized protein LOC131954547 [Physella acuta]